MELLQKDNYQFRKREFRFSKWILRSDIRESNLFINEQKFDFNSFISLYNYLEWCLRFDSIKLISEQCHWIVHQNGVIMLMKKDIWEVVIVLLRIDVQHFNEEFIYNIWVNIIKLKLNLILMFLLIVLMKFVKDSKQCLLMEQNKEHNNF
jgi:hypothetical protein